MLRSYLKIYGVRFAVSAYAIGEIDTIAKCKYKKSNIVIEVNDYFCT